MQSIELIAPRYDIAWYPWAVQYFFLVALSYASLWLALPNLLLNRLEWRQTARLALLAAVSTAIVAPVSLLADLHQPLRFWHFYAYPTPWSWMSLGSIFLPLYAGATIVLGWLVWREPMQEWRQTSGLAGMVARIVPFGRWASPRWLIVTVALFAFLMSLLVMVYTGAEVAILKGRPLWHTEFLPMMFLATGLIGASGLVMILNRFAWKRDGAVSLQMSSVLLGACILAGLTAAGWFAVGLSEHDASVATALESVRNNSDWRWMTFRAIATGGLLFLAAMTMLILRGTRGFGWIVGLLALHTAWMFRWAVLMNVQTVQRQTAGFSEYHLALGSQGFLGIIGTFGLWLAVLMLIDLFVPWRASLGRRTAAPVPSDSKGVPSRG